MVWKKLLETKDVIAYEKASNKFKVRIEARLNRDRWLVYKTYNFIDGQERISHVKEYVANSTEEARELLTDLKNENDLTIKDISSSYPIKIELKRCYKEEYVEKWKFKIDEFSDDNFIVVHYDEQIKLDIILHDRYNLLEKQILGKIINSLGLKDISSTIHYDFYYFRKHSAKRRIYQDKADKEVIAKMEFSYDQEE
jgi:hypothetical protein